MTFSLSIPKYFHLLMVETQIEISSDSNDVSLGSFLNDMHQTGVTSGGNESISDGSNIGDLDENLISLHYQSADSR